MMKIYKGTVIKLVAAVMLLALALAVFPSCSKGDKYDADFSLPTRSIPEDAKTQSFGSYKYQVYDDNTILLTEYSGSEQNVIIPDKIDGKNVVALGDLLFADNESIKSVKLGKNIEILGEYCFDNSPGLYDVQFNDKLWSVGVSAFGGTAWIDTMTDEFVIVGDGVLIAYTGNAGYVEIPSSVKHISSAFNYNETLAYVDMGPTVLTLGSHAFANCSNLRGVTFGENLLYIGAYAFANCDYMSNILIPDKVVRIEVGAFMYCLAATSVKIGNSVESIGDSAFYSISKLRSIYMPTSLKYIESYAFSECYSIESIFYQGSEEQFALIERDTTNYLLNDAPKVYNATKGE